MIQQIGLLDLLTLDSVFDEELGSDGLIAVPIERIHRYRRFIENKHPSIRIECNRDSFEALTLIDREGIKYSETQVTIKRDSHGYAVIKKAYRLNRTHSSMEFIYNEIRTDLK